MSAELAGPMLFRPLLLDAVLTAGPVATMEKRRPYRPIIVQGRAYTRH